MKFEDKCAETTEKKMFNKLSQLAELSKLSKLIYCVVAGKSEPFGS